jgi:hypothetical protein
VRHDFGAIRGDRPDYEQKSFINREAAAPGSQGVLSMSRNKKITLNKDAVRMLSGGEMQGVVGGALNATIIGHCSDNCCSKSCSTCGCPSTSFCMDVAMPTKVVLTPKGF